MKRLRLGPVIAVYVTCAFAVAQTETKPWASEPDSYRGVKFGASVETARETVTFARCMSRESLRREAEQAKSVLGSDPGAPLIDRFTRMMPEGGTLCDARHRIADVDVRETWKFDEKSRLVMVSFSFESRGYQTLRDVFVEKFGQPHSAKTEIVQNLMNAQFENENLSWHGVGSHVTLSRYGSNLTKGLAFFFTAVEFEAWTKREAGKKAKAKDAF